MNRSAKPPAMSATVIMANMPWKTMNACSSGPTPTMPNLVRSPTKPRPPTLVPKARLYPHSTHSTLTTPMAVMECIIVPMTFLWRTSPP